MIIIIWQCSSRTWHSRNTKSLLDQGVLLSLYQVAVVKISKIFPHLDIDDRIIPPKASKSHQFKCSQWQGNINDILHQKKPSQPAAGLPLSVSASHEQPAKIVWNKVSKSLVKIKINPVVNCGEWRPQSTRSRRRLEGGRWELLRPREAPTDQHLVCRVLTIAKCSRSRLIGEMSFLIINDYQDLWACQGQGHHGRRRGRRWWRSAPALRGSTARSSEAPSEWSSSSSPSP